MHPDHRDRLRDPAAEARLIGQIQRRDADWRSAIDRLLAHHQRAVYARCLSYLRHPADADDATQETLFRAFRAIESFKGDAAFRTWLFAIADNQCHTLARKRARLQPDEQLEGLLQLANEVAIEPENPVADCREVVHDAMARVTATGRDILQLRYFADLSIDEIAFTLGLGLSAAKMRLYRAQEQLAALVGECRMDRAV